MSRAPTLLQQMSSEPLHMALTGNYGALSRHEAWHDASIWTLDDSHYLKERLYELLMLLNRLNKWRASLPDRSRDAVVRHRLPKKGLHSMARNRSW